MDSNGFYNSAMSWLFRSVNLSWAVPGDNNSPMEWFRIDSNRTNEQEHVGTY